MPKAPQLERGRAGTHVQVCGAPASASAQPCMALGRFCFFCSPGPQPQWEGVVTGLQESGKWGPRGLIWPPGERAGSLKAERGRVWGRKK